MNFCHIANQLVKICTHAPNKTNLAYILRQNITHGITERVRYCDYLLALSYNSVKDQLYKNHFCYIYTGMHHLVTLYVHNYVAMYSYYLQNTFSMKPLFTCIRSQLHILDIYVLNYSILCHELVSVIVNRCCSQLKSAMDDKQSGLASTFSTDTVGIPLCFT